MEIFTIISEFDEALGNLRQERLSVVERANKGIGLCRKTLGLLRNEVVAKGFPNEISEIHFFKEIKPIPMQHLVYYTEVHKCELKLPRLGLKSQLKFLQIERKRLNAFFGSYLEFHRYLLEGRTDRDTHYFTREKGTGHPIREGYAYRYDNEFETSHDMLLATFKGLERYGNYLKEMENRLTALGTGVPGTPMDGSPAFLFTLPDTAAVELAYALREARAINHGDFEIKAFVEYFGKVFGIEVKEPYMLLSQIANRKKERAKYLSRLLDAFLGFLDGRDA